MTDPLPDTRVSAFFDRFRESLEAAGKLKPPGPGDPPDVVFDWFRLRCVRRLEQGALSYGNADFLRPDRDLVEEALEEQMDLVNYVLMERAKHTDDPDAAALDEAVALSFQVVKALLRYRGKLRGVSG